MAKKKVTLSVDSRVYEDFKKHCDENAIMLSKKIELFMKNFLKGKKEFIFLFFIFILLSFNVKASIMGDFSLNDFNNGSYFKTFYNSSGFLQLNTSQGFIIGNFTSRVFNVGSAAKWMNISWTPGAKYGFELPNSRQSENEYWGVNMSGNILLLHFNEARGIQNFSDSSGTVANFTCESTSTCPFINSSGRYGSALDFDGNNDGVIEGTTASKLNFTSDLTIEAWIYWRGESGENNNIQNIITNGNWERSLRITEPDHFHGGKQIFVNYKIGGISGGLYSNSNISLRNWTYVAFTYNGSSLRIYVNGRLDSFNDSVSGDFVNADTPTVIGAESASVSNFYGLIDEVAIYNRSLSSNELYNRYVRGAANINLSVRSCENSLCTGDNFSTLNASSHQNLDLLNNTYFQYKLDFISENTYGTAQIYNVTVNYNLLNSAPNVIVFYPINSSLFASNSSINLNFTSTDLENNVDSCWYNLDGGNNITLDNCSNSSFNASQGSHYIEIFVNDSVGALSKNRSYFSIDSISPNLTILSPLNVTSASTSVFLNYTAEDISGVSSCWYSRDGLVNLTLSGCGTATLTGFGQGQHEIDVYSNDTLGNMGLSRVFFGVDSVGPGFNNIEVGIPEIYLQSEKTEFNISWSDSGVGISNVWMESNFSGSVRNYSMYLIGGGKYSLNVSLGAGEFYYKFYSNDTLNNVNSSGAFIGNIAKAGNSIKLYLNGNQSNLTINYGVATNATAYGDLGLINLYRDGNLIGNSENALLGFKSGGYEYHAIINGNDNYTSNETKIYAFVNKAEPNLILAANGNGGNFTLEYGNQTNINASEQNYGDSDLIYNFYINDILVGNGSSISYNNTLGAGNYRIEYNTSGGENFTSKNIMVNISVIKATPNLILEINGFEGNSKLIYGDFCNISFKINPGLEVVLYREGLIIDNGEREILGAGYYNYTAAFFGNDNYTVLQKSLFLNITKAEPQMELTLNEESSDLSIAFGSNLQVKADISLPINNIIRLYEDSNLVDFGNDLTKNINYSSLGAKIWKVEFVGNENYSEENLSHTVVITDPNGPQYSNLRTNHISGINYAPNEVYQFNSTWIDDLAIDDVIFEFNGKNYSYLAGQLIKGGVEYYALINNLGAGNYTYRWWGNDSSGNLVGTIPLQNYVINKGLTALFMSFSPSDNIGYGEESSVICIANNGQSSIQLSRNGTLVGNPNVEELGIGQYYYICNALESENYTSAITSSILTVGRGNPNIRLYLNSIESDLTISSGASINISVFGEEPVNMSLNLSINGINAAQGYSKIELLNTFSNPGEYLINVSFEGDENYSSYSISRKITVNPIQQQQEQNNGGGGGGGGGTFFDIKNISGKLNFEFSDLGVIEIKEEESKEVSLYATNKEKDFVNNCNITAEGILKEWIKADGEKGFANGEMGEFKLNISVPLGVDEGVYKDNLILQCQEGNASDTIIIKVYKKSFDAVILDYERVGNILKVNYQLADNSNRSHEVNLNYRLLDAEGLAAYEGKDIVALGEGEVKKFILNIELPKDSFGEFKLDMGFDDSFEKVNVVKAVFLPTGGLTGFSISGESNKTLNLIGIIVLITVLLTGLLFAIKYTYEYYQIKKNPMLSKLKNMPSRKVIRLNLVEKKKN